MATTKPERNCSILRLHEQGVRPSRIAKQQGVTPARITQIIATTRIVEERKAVLEKRYGKHPDIAHLSDAAPFDVLMLCQSATYGWVARVRSLCMGQQPLKTLGDLRSITDAELLAKPGVGDRLFAELRAVCPRRAPTGRGSAPARVRSAKARPPAVFHYQSHQDK